MPVAGEAGTSVDEAGLPVRGSEPEGTGEFAAAGANGDTSETTTGTINFTPGDSPAMMITIDGLGAGGPVTITGEGQTIVGQYGTLTVNGYNAATGTITYSYTLADNTSGNGTHDDFTVTVTDADGDTASSTLVIAIVDDEPIARNDTDSGTENNLIAAGNVMTAVGTTNSPAGAERLARRCVAHRRPRRGPARHDVRHQWRPGRPSPVWPADDRCRRQ